MFRRANGDGNMGVNRVVGVFFKSQGYLAALRGTHVNFINTSKNSFVARFYWTPPPTSAPPLFFFLGRGGDLVLVLHL